MGVYPYGFVDASPDSKTGTCQLRATWKEERKATHVGEPLAASNMLALVRLLPRVGADVDGQGASLDEGLAAAGCRTRVRALVGVNAVVSLQVRLAVEALHNQRVSGKVLSGTPRT